MTVEKVKNTPNIELVLNAKVQEVYGGKMGVEGVKVAFNDGKERDIQVPGIFTFVGMNVNNGLLRQQDGKYLCEVNDSGEVVVDLSMKTSTPGVFAAGDIRIQAPKQVVCAAGDGATAALSAMAYLENH